MDVNRHEVLRTHEKFQFYLSMSSQSYNRDKIYGVKNHITYQKHTTNHQNISTCTYHELLQCGFQLLSNLFPSTNDTHQ